MSRTTNTERTGRRLLCFITVFAAASLLFTLWYAGAFLPDWVLLQDRSFADSGREYDLKRGRLRITRDKALYYESPSVWRVQDALLQDLDRDGQNEVILLVWKRGSYGNHRPSWVSRDEIAHSQHIFIYKPEKERLRAIWMSSALDIRVRELAPEGEHFLCVTEPDGRRSIWGWITWGLMLVGHTR